MNDRRTEEGLLPSISAAHGRVAGHLGRVGLAGDAGGAAIGPLDALLLTLYLRLRADRVAVVDLASAATRGASTLLAASQPTALAVAADRPADGPGGWPSALAEALDELGPRGACPVGPIGAAPAGRPGVQTVVLVHAAEDLADRLGDAARLAPGAPVLVLGLGRTGDCPAVAELVARSSAGPARLALFRELGGVLGESRVGLLAAPSAEATALSRVSAAFAGNFDFLRLVEGLCRAAVAATQLDEATRAKVAPAASRGGIDVERLVRLLIEAARERDELRRDVDNLLGLVWHLQQERDALRGDLEDASRPAVAVAAPKADAPATQASAPPPASLARRAARVWRRDGVGGLLRRIHHRAGAAVGIRRP